MLARGVCGLSLLLLAATPLCSAVKSQLSVDTGECGEDTPTHQTVTKTAEFTDKVHGLRAYGELSFRRQNGSGSKNGCHVVYELFVALPGQPFEQVKELAWDTEVGEIAGVDLIGVSPDGSKLAADFLLAEGDGEEHRAVVYDAATRQAIDRPLEDRIQKQIHGCDQNEDFIGVTNSGEAIFAVPPSEYDDSPGCGDKGLWHFNLTTGRVYRVAKISGDKWE